MNPDLFQDMSFENSYKLASPAQGHLLQVETSPFVLRVTLMPSFGTFLSGTAHLNHASKNSLCALRVWGSLVGCSGLQSFVHVAQGSLCFLQHPWHRASWYWTHDIHHRYLCSKPAKCKLELKQALLVKRHILKSPSSVQPHLEASILIIDLTCFSFFKQVFAHLPEVFRSPRCVRNYCWNVCKGTRAWLCDMP